MTRRLFTAVAVAMLLVAGSAYAEVTPIPPPYPHGCDVNGTALQGDAAPNDLRGTPMRDLLRGGGQSDELSGLDAHDCLFGQAGHDDLDGGGALDILRGGAGMDHLGGGPGPDRITGGEGDDRVRDLRGQNTIDCGPGGFDRVTTNQRSRVAPKCEHVLSR